MEDSLAAVNASLDLLGELVARHRVDPRPGLLANLIARHGDDLSDRELAELADGLLTTGHETTASMLALGALALLEQPALDRAPGPARRVPPPGAGSCARPDRVP